VLATFLLQGVAFGLLLTDSAAAQEYIEPPESAGITSDGVSAAPVILDGEVLFRVRGISPDPAKERARRIRDRLVGLATKSAVKADGGRLVRNGNRIDVIFGTTKVVTLYDADAALEQIDIEVLAEATLERISAAIQQYRTVRGQEPLLRSTGVLAGITFAAIVLWFAIRKFFGWLDRAIQRRVKRQIDKLEKASHRVFDARQFWHLSGGLLRALRLIMLIAVFLTWLNSALGIYPWTRPFAAEVFRLILDPLKAIGYGILNSLPDLAFIVVLVYIIRIVLRVTRTFFERVHRGSISLNNFDQEWALPTFRIVRVLVFAFGVIVAYPYIPGSQSDAFKGVSLFLGVIFSIGSSSFIGNIISGYSLTYRRAFRVGDRVQIGELVGDVIDTRMLSTQLRSTKNEEINIPNSVVLASHVINFSSLGESAGLILHTEVGIGYDVPWRQVEALLRMAAERTDGLVDDPPLRVERPL
jgi:small-conductance mechanosensitive channel